MARHAVFCLVWFSAVLAVSFAALAADSNLRRYDSNGNNQLDNPEFFNVVDDWLANEISNEIFFSAIDLWLSDGPISQSPSITPKQQPVAELPSCPDGARLVAMRNGIPYSTYEQMRPESGLGPVIEIAFSDAVFLPKGANVQLSIISDTQGLEPRNGAFRQPIQYSTFFNLGPSQIAGTGSVRDGTLVQAQYEWASFAPFWDDYATTGTITFEVQITAPGCSKTKMSGRINLRKVTALDAGQIIIQQSVVGQIFSMSTGESFQLLLFDAAGRLLYRSLFASHASLNAALGPTRLARGVYFAKIVGKIDGDALTTTAIKLILPK